MNKINNLIDPEKVWLSPDGRQVEGLEEEGERAEEAPTASDKNGHWDVQCSTGNAVGETVRTMHGGQWVPGSSGVTLKGR